MVVVSILPHAEFGPNDHQEDAHHFIYKKIIINSRSEFRVGELSLLFTFASRISKSIDPLFNTGPSKPLGIISKCEIKCFLTSTVVAQFIPVKALMYDNHHNANFTSSSDDNLSLLFSGIVLFYFLLCLSLHLNIMLSNAVKFTACKHKRSVILIPEIKSE